jgi:LuxR family transcriptional regulator, quorum-sensing system regulator CviR
MFEELSHGELSRLMELAGRCLVATTSEQLGSVISSLYDLASFRKAALCALSVDKDEVALAHYVNHSYGAKWADLYVSQSFHRVDQVLHHASTAEGAFSWDDVAAPAGRDGSAFLAATEAFGLTAGMSFSCAGITAPFRSLISVAGVPPRELERTGRILGIVGPHLHEAYRRVLQRPQARGSAVELSAREREVLCWAQQGKTYWEIGCILGISERTVKFHVARIKSRLDVASVAHAIAKAMRMGLMS